MLVDIEELSARLPFDMSPEELREANGALEDLSFDAQAINSRWADEASTPASVKNIILRAATRHMKNYEGYTASRAGDEQVAWADQGESAGTATFTRDEKRALEAMAGKEPFIGSVNTTAWGRSDRPIGLRPGYVPTTQGSPFPMFADETEPW